MSGVYIKGLKMPTACCACPCNYDNVCAITNKYPTFEEWYEIKPSWCPLVPVPDHGRLIDADEIGEHKFVTMPPYLKTYGDGRQKSDEEAIAFRFGWNNAIEAIMGYAPTIIPADKDGAE